MKTEDIKTLTERHAAIKAECEKLGAEIERLKAGRDGTQEADLTAFETAYQESFGRFHPINFSRNHGIGEYVYVSALAIAAYRGWILGQASLKEADEQIQFLRRAMTAGDLAPDAVGYGIYMSKGGYPTPFQYEGFDCFRKFSTMEARDAFIKSEGGIEVFRARLAKGWPV